MPSVARKANNFFDKFNEIDFRSFKRDTRIENDEFLKNLSSGEPADTNLKPIGPEEDDPVLRGIHQLHRRMQDLERYMKPK